MTNDSVGSLINWHFFCLQRFTTKEERVELVLLSGCEGWTCGKTADEFHLSTKPYLICGGKTKIANDISCVHTLWTSCLLF